MIFGSLNVALQADSFQIKNVSVFVRTPGHVCHWALSLHQSTKSIAVRLENRDDSINCRRRRHHDCRKKTWLHVQVGNLTKIKRFIARYKPMSN